MLPKANRFSFKERLPRQTLNSQSFSLKYGKNEEGLRVGVVVSKKVDKRAVVRNRIKRKIVETVQKNLDLKQNLTLVFYVKKTAVGLEIEQEVTDSIGKIKN